jgi:hypothetical protein
MLPRLLSVLGSVGITFFCTEHREGPRRSITTNTWLYGSALASS